MRDSFRRVLVATVPVLGFGVAIYCLRDVVGRWIVGEGLYDYRYEIHVQKVAFFVFLAFSALVVGAMAVKKGR